MAEERKAYGCVCTIADNRYYLYKEDFEKMMAELHHLCGMEGFRFITFVNTSGETMFIPIRTIDHISIQKREE